MSEERKLDEEQYKFLKECSKEGKSGIEKWNKWRLENPEEEIWLCGADLPKACLEGALLCAGPVEVPVNGRVEKVVFGDVHVEGSNLWKANLKKAHLERAKLDGADLRRAELGGANVGEGHLKGTKLQYSKLTAVDLSGAHLEGANFGGTIVDGETLIWNCTVDDCTLFSGVGLDSCRVHPGLKQTLRYIVRRHRWLEWHKDARLLRSLCTKVHLELPRGLAALDKWLTWVLIWVFARSFWAISDHGRSTGRIIATFFVFALLFGALYSVVTMTTLGFGDIYAEKHSLFGHLFLMLQVLLGYVLLGALVTRFAVMFSGSGPAAKHKRSRRD